MKTVKLQKKKNMKTDKKFKIAQHIQNNFIPHKKDEIKKIILKLD